MKNKGNVLMIGVIFVSIVIVIITFIIAVFMSHINNILYNIKLDMYSMNKTAVISVNKNITSMDKFSYNETSYKKEFVNLLRKNYELDENMSNNEKLINRINVKEYDIYEEREKDSFSKKRCDDRTIHTVLEIRITPIILKEFLKDIFIFTIHEDVSLNMMKVK